MNVKRPRVSTFAQDTGKQSDVLRADDGWVSSAGLAYVA